MKVKDLIRYLQMCEAVGLENAPVLLHGIDSEVMAIGTNLKTKEVTLIPLNYEITGMPASLLIMDEVKNA